MDREFILGRMEGNMKALMKMIKRRDLEFIRGRMAGNTRAFGRRESNMEVGSLFKETKGGKEFGRRERESNG